MGLAVGELASDDVLGNAIEDDNEGGDRRGRGRACLSGFRRGEVWFKGCGHQACGSIGAWCIVGWELDGLEGVGAAEADGGVVCFFAYIFGEAPAALALSAFGGFSLDVKGALFDVALGDDGVGEMNLGYAEEFGKDGVVALEDGVGVAGDGVEPTDGDLNFRGAVADGFCGAGFFEGFQGPRRGG